MRIRALVLGPACLLVMAAGAAAPSFAYDHLSATITKVDAVGRITLSDGSVLAPAKTVLIDGLPEAGATASVSFSGDENGYDIKSITISRTPRDQVPANPGQLPTRTN